MYGWQTAFLGESSSRRVVLAVCSKGAYEVDSGGGEAGLWERVREGERERREGEEGSERGGGRGGRNEERGEEGVRGGE